MLRQVVLRMWKQQVIPPPVGSSFRQFQEKFITISLVKEVQQVTIDMQIVSNLINSKFNCQNQ